MTTAGRKGEAPGDDRITEERTSARDRAHWLVKEVQDRVPGAADEVTAASLAESLATIAAADEVAAEAAGEAGERINAASITMAEAQVLRYLPGPAPFSVIADKLGISRSAAKERATRLYHRLGVHSREEAVSRASALGLTRAK